MQSDPPDYPSVRHPVCDCVVESESELTTEIMHLANVAARTLLMNNQLSSPGVCGRNLMVAALFSAYIVLVNTNGIEEIDEVLDREIDEAMSKIRSSRDELRRVIEVRSAMRESEQQEHKH